MENEQIHQLTVIAQNRMQQCLDPIHKIDHVVRVVETAKKIGMLAGITNSEMSSLLLAAWWHDIGRTVTRRPSLIWMPFVDDILSALFLFLEMVRQRIFNRTVITAVLLILCKSLGTGKVFTKLLLKKKHRAILDMLLDSDTLDMLHPIRGDQLCRMVETSKVYKYGYRVMISWFFFSTQIKMRTEAGKRFFKDILYELYRWFCQVEVLAWHVKYYGELFVQNIKGRLEVFLHELGFHSHQMSTN